MQALFLTYYQRVMLWNIVGGHTAGSVREAAVHIRLLEKIRLSDSESVESSFKMVGAQFSWQLPSANYGDKIVELENDEAKALADVIEKIPSVKVSDAEWLIKVVSDLQPEEEPKGNA